MAVTQEQAGEALTQTKAEILKLNRVIALEMTRRDFKVVKSSGRGGLDSSGGVTPQKCKKQRVLPEFCCCFSEPEQHGSVGGVKHFKCTADVLIIPLMKTFQSCLCFREPSEDGSFLHTSL